MVTFKLVEIKTENNIDKYADRDSKIHSDKVIMNVNIKIMILNILKED